MRSVSRHLWTDQHGVVLAMTLILMGLMSAMAAAYSTLIRADTVVRGATGRERQGFYAAEAGLNLSMADVRNDFTSGGTLSTTADVSFDVGTRTVRYVVGPSSATPGPGTIVPSGLPFAGLSTDPSHFSVTSVAENTEGDTEALLGAQFSVHTVPIFRFLAFYNEALEILPEQQSMNLTGRIHTNGDLYLDDALTIDDDDNPSNPYVQVSAAGSIYRGRKHDTTCSGTVTIDKLEDGDTNGSLDSQVLGCVGGASAEVSTTTIAAYQGSVLSDVTPIRVPTIDIDRNSGDSDSFWKQADLRIVLRRDLARIIVNFAGFCPGDANVPAAVNYPTALFPIEVQTAGGDRDIDRTNALWTFMCNRRGAIFYNEMPNTLPTLPLGIPATGTANEPSNPNNYAQAFSGNARVYRRVGEDTNGDGVINTSDMNDDICPVSQANPPPRPWWVPLSCSWPNISANLPSTSWFNDTDYRRGGFYNWREGRWVIMLNVNIRALIGWNNSIGGGLFPLSSINDGLVIFLSVQAADSNTIPANYRYGVRVFDSADFDSRGDTFSWPAPSNPTGLTVVSDQAIYIQGNYNTVHKYPAAVIGDTVNVLSQTWEVTVPNTGGFTAVARQWNNDRKSATALTTSRNLLASDGYYDTTLATPAMACAAGGCTAFNNGTSFGINVALIAGADQPDSGYSGGLENHLRFHEDWNPGTARTLNFQGSLVSLGEPQYADGSWCGMGSGCNIYDEPVRSWDYDTAFDLNTWLPPLTPMVDMLHQRVYTRF